MRLSFRLKHHFFNAFREFFVHHHGSLDFRAKVFALMIAVNAESDINSYITIKDISLNLYKNDEDRANLLMITTKEKVNMLKKNNNLNTDILVASIQKDLKTIPRYAKKIDTQELRKIMALTHDEDTLLYQENILEFLQTLKNDTLKEKKKQIDKDEVTFHSQFAS